MALANPPTPSYNITTLLDMSVNSAFAKQFCPPDPANPDANGNPQHTCYIEGSTRDNFGNIFVSAVQPKGEIFKITPDGHASLYATFDLGPEAATPFAADSNSVSFRLATDDLGDVYVSFRALDNTTSFVEQTPTDMNGIWLVHPGGGHCSLDAKNTCEKIWPAIGQQPTNPPLRWIDGIALDHRGSIYLADGQMGNIWKINLLTRKGALWAGVDAGSSPNYLAGSPFNIVLGSPISGRGFGVLGLAYDYVENVLYGATFDTGSVVRIPVNNDGSAGKQSVLLNLSANNQNLDSIYVAQNTFNPFDRKIYVGVDLVNFVPFAKYIGCALEGIAAFCPASPTTDSDGHEIWGASLNDPKGITFTLLINNPELDIAASVVNGVLDPNILYLDALGENEASGAKVLKATPVFSH